VQTQNAARLSTLPLTWQLGEQLNSAARHGQLHDFLVIALAALLASVGGFKKKSSWCKLYVFALYNSMCSSGF
jgi:hypothetical protein